MKIYRVEDFFGNGAYRVYGDPEPSWRRDQFKDYRTPEEDPHPSPFDDGLEGLVPGKEFFAFDTLSKIRNWMFREPEDSTKMQQLGLYVVVLEVAPKHVRIGGRQCVYIRDKAAMVERFDPVNFELQFLS